MRAVRSFHQDLVALHPRLNARDIRMPISRGAGELIAMSEIPTALITLPVRRKPSD